VKAKIKELIVDFEENVKEEALIAQIVE